MDHSAWMDLVVARAAELRALGVLELEVEGCAVRFAPLPPPPLPVPPPGTKSTETEEQLDALHDPASWPGGVVPGFDIEPLTEEF